MGRPSLNNPSTAAKKAQKNVTDADIRRRIDSHRMRGEFCSSIENFAHIFVIILGFKIAKTKAIELLRKSLAAQLIDDKESQALVAGMDDSDIFD